MIKLHDELYLETDGDQWILGKKTRELKNKKGEITGETVAGEWYFNSLENTLQFIFRHQIKMYAKNKHTISDLFNAVSDAKKFVNDLIDQKLSF